MEKFKVGDKVRVLEGFNIKELVGKIGTVYRVNKVDIDIIFDDFVGGHSGDANDNSINHWYIKKTDEYIKIVQDIIEFPKDTVVSIEIKSEEKKEMKILEIYEKRGIEYIRERYEREKKIIISNDEIQKIVLKAQEEIKQRIKEDISVDIETNCDILEDKTKEDLKQLSKDYAVYEDVFNEKIEEIKAQLDIAEDYKTKIEILKRYEVLDEDGKITAFESPLVACCCDVDATIVDKNGKVKKSKKLFERK